MDLGESKIDHEIYDRANEKKITDVEKVVKEGEIVQMYAGTDTDGRGIIIYDRVLRSPQSSIKYLQLRDLSRIWNFLCFSRNSPDFYIIRCGSSGILKKSCPEVTRTRFQNRSPAFDCCVIKIFFLE